MKQHPYILENPPKRQPISDIQSYNVLISTTITGVEEPVKSTVEYALEINYGNHFFTFSKTHIVIDGSPVPNKINELYLKVAEPLNNIEFRCKENGMVKDLYKHRKLLSLWKQKKKQITKEFTGDYVDQLLQQLDMVYSDKDTLKHRFSANLVLQTFYRSFLNNYLVYYGQNETEFTSAGILGGHSLPFKGVKKLGLEGEQLYLHADVELDKEKVNGEVLNNHFKNRVATFRLEDLNMNQKYESFLDYESAWIKKSHVIQTTELGNYRKKVVLTLINKTTKQ